MGAADGELVTERLTLRRHALQDFADSMALWGDPEVTRYIGSGPVSREDAWARLLRYAGHWAMLGFGFWVVRETATGRFVGEVGMAEWRRDIEPRIEGAPEIGWVLSPLAHGHGYATEAARAALTWGEARFGAARTVCIMDAENAGSLRVAGKLGFEVYARTTYKDAATLILQRPASARQQPVE